MPTPAPAHRLLGRVATVLAEIGEGAAGLAEDGMALAESLGSGFSGAVDSSIEEWEAFVDGLSDHQAEALAEVSVFMERAGALAGRLTACRQMLLQGNLPQASPDDPGRLVEDGWSLVAAGADVLAKLMLAFPGEDGIRAAIVQASPLLARRLSLEA